MKYRNRMTCILAAVAFAACSEPERTSDAAPVSGTTRVTLQREGGGNVSVYAFRQQEEVYLYDTLFRDGWSPEGTLRVRMPNGRYKFLFACGTSDRLVLQPAPLTRTTAWDDARFALRENSDRPGTYLPADELFLQYPASDANTVYTVNGTHVTVPARLSRAVSRIDVTLKRGYRSGTAYVEVPYAKPRTILDEIDRIELAAARTGLRVGPAGSVGTATVTATLSASDYAELTEDGFVRLEGPFVLPSADGGEVVLDFSIVPAAGASLHPAQLQVTGRAERNKRLDVTLWITSGYPEIGVEIRTAPIGREEDGDTGIWE